MRILYPLITLFKGAGPGTHWNKVNAKLNGFQASAMIKDYEAIKRHIMTASYPSPYISFTTSYAIAHEYASMGPNGIASPSNPGYVYEVKIRQNDLCDPVLETAQRGLAHRHDGEQDLIVGVATIDPRICAKCVPRLGYLQHPPNISNKFETLIFAIRDAEVLATHVAASAVQHRHPITEP